MTEANLNLHPSQPFDQYHEQLYCLNSSARSVHNFREKTVIHLTLGATSSVAKLNKVCTQFEENLAVHLPR